MTKPTVQAEVEMVYTFIVKPGDSWGEECSIKQVRGQAETSAKSIMHKMLTAMDGHVTCKHNPQVKHVQIIASEKLL